MAVLALYARTSLSLHHGPWLRSRHHVLVPGGHFNVTILFIRVIVRAAVCRPRVAHGVGDLEWCALGRLGLVLSATKEAQDEAEDGDDDGNDTDGDTSFGSCRQATRADFFGVVVLFVLVLVRV
jgi:hypothetical protein